MEENKENRIKSVGGAVNGMTQGRGKKVKYTKKGTRRIQEGYKRDTNICHCHDTGIIHTGIHRRTSPPTVREIGKVVHSKFTEN